MCLLICVFLFPNISIAEDDDLITITVLTNEIEVGKPITVRYSIDESASDLFAGWYEYSGGMPIQIGYCNGFNPVGNTRDEFMRNCMATSYDLLQSNGSIDLDCEAFRQMAEYTCENVMDNDIDNIFAHSANWCQIDIYGTNQWLDEVKHNFPDGQEDLIGFPSPDGRGPAAEIRSCVSITKSCRSPEGAWRDTRGRAPHGRPAP